MEYIKSGNTYAVRLNKGEEIIESIIKLCNDEDIKAGTVSALGASDYAELGVFRTGEKKYYSNLFTGDMEISNLTGNISRQNGKPYIHCHITLGKPDGSAVAGHLSKCVISATCEMFVTVLQMDIDRRFDDEVGLNLMKF